MQSQAVATALPVSLINPFVVAFTDFLLDMPDGKGAESLRLPHRPFSVSFSWFRDQCFRDPGPSLAGWIMSFMCAGDQSKENHNE